MFVGHGENGIIISEHIVEDQKTNIIINGDLIKSKECYLTPNVYQKKDNYIFISKNKDLYNEYSKIFNNFDKSNEMYQVRLLNFNSNNNKTFYNPFLFASSNADIVSFVNGFIGSFSYVATKPLNRTEMIKGLHYLMQMLCLYVFNYEDDDNKSLKVVKKYLDTMANDVSILDMKVAEMIKEPGIYALDDFYRFFLAFKTLSYEVQVESIYQIKKIFDNISKTKIWDSINMNNSITMQELIAEKNALFIIPSSEFPISDMFLFQFLSAQKNLEEIAAKGKMLNMFKIKTSLEEVVERFDSSNFFNIFLYDFNHLNITNNLMAFFMNYNAHSAINIFTDDENVLYDKLQSVNKYFQLFFEIVIDFTGNTIYPNKYFNKKAKMNLKENEMNIFKLSFDGNEPDIHMLLDNIYDYTSHPNFNGKETRKRKKTISKEEQQKVDVENIFKNIECHTKSDGVKNTNKWKF